MSDSNETEAENKASVLFKFYTRKVFSKIKSPEKTKQRSGPDRKSHNE